MKMETNKNILEQIKLKDKPEVPEAYFDQLATNILSQIKKEEIHKSKRLIYMRPSFWLSAAAASVILFFGIRSFIQTPEIEIKDLSHGEILAYVEDNLDDIDAELLIESAELDGFYSKESPSKSVSPNKKVVSETNHPDSLSNEEILQYLNTQEIDLEEIEEIY